MYPWRGVLIHVFFVLTQPSYLAIRYTLDSEYFHRASTAWLAIAIVIWIFMVTKFSVPFFTSPLRHLPCPAAQRFPWGHFRIAKTPPTEVVKKLIEDTPNDGLILLWGPFYCFYELIPTRPDVVMEMINKHSYDWVKPSMSARFLGLITGNGLIVAEGDEHKAMRKVLSPAFTGHHLRDLVPLFYAKALAMMKSMAQEAQHDTDRVVEVAEQMSRATLDIIGSAGVGKDFNIIENNSDALARLYAIMTNPEQGGILLTALVHAFVPSWIVRRLRGTRYARMADAHAELRAEGRALIQEKKRTMIEKSEQQKDIIATVLKSGDFSDDYLVNQLLTFLAAGHETTATALTWTIWFLCQHPDIQDRLRAECTPHLSGKAPSEIKASTFDAETMPYLTAVCNESLRFYPVVPVIARYSVRPTHIGNQAIPQGTLAAVSIWTFNRSPAFWGADAEKFNPDRWLDTKKNGDGLGASDISSPSSLVSSGGAKHPYAFLTFLYGPRSCIGQTFARIEMKCLLATLVTRFKFEMADPDEEIRMTGFVTIKPQNGLRVKLTDLQHRNEKTVGSE